MITFFSLISFGILNNLIWLQLNERDMKQFSNTKTLPATEAPRRFQITTMLDYVTDKIQIIGDQSFFRINIILVALGLWKKILENEKSD